ncbi:unnamed protein product [Ectocarpus fasciculatus]
MDEASRLRRWVGRTGRRYTEARKKRRPRRAGRARSRPLRLPLGRGQRRRPLRRAASMDRRPGCRWMFRARAPPRLLVRSRLSRPLSGDGGRCVSPLLSLSVLVDIRLSAYEQGALRFCGES